MTRALLWLAVGFVALFPLGSASNPGLIYHSFSFDLRGDGQDAAVLDYRYGESKMPVRAPEWAVREGKELYFNSVTGSMLRGDLLYVKWRNRNTSQVFEDTVDLRQRLPADIANHRVHFMIRGPQLYVYLVSPERRRPEMLPNGPRVYQDFKTTTIYPDSPRQ